ncbi:MAG: hypothetical protein KGJ78_11805 [Alphaproteobacteria bacterium]|nr:hypothetical protein [Alphaproteobacteria bacterium]
MASAHSLSGLMKWLQRDEWREPFNELLALHVGGACADAGITVEDLPAIIGEDSVGVLWGCAFEDFLAYEFEDGRNIVDDYLKRRGWNESVPNKRYMAALRVSVMSLYEISDIVRDEGFLARDLVRGGDPVRISEKSGTHSLKQWDRIAVRIVPCGERVEMSGGALPFGHDLCEAVLDGFAELKKEMRSEIRKHVEDKAVVGRIDQFALDTEVLHHAGFLFTNVWLNDVLERALNPKLPELRNSDGDEIVWTTATYPLTPGADPPAIRLALARIPSLRVEGETFWNWIGVKKRAGRKSPKAGQTITTTLDDGSTVLGTLELKGRTMTFEANSPERSKRGRALIEPVLAGLVGPATVDSKTVAEMMASRPATTAKEVLSPLAPEEERAVLHTFLEQHYRNLLDEPVPMLGNVSPRRAAKTAAGRRKLVDWLKVLENGAAKDVSAGYDLRWMWDELCIADLRR